MKNSPIALSIFSLSLIILYTFEQSTLYMALGLLLGLLAASIEIKNILGDKENKI